MLGCFWDLKVAQHKVMELCTQNGMVTLNSFN